MYRLCYSVARRLIRSKIVSKILPTDLLGLSEADITHDCIVELFSLGPSNELHEIVKYFNYQGISAENEPEEHLFVHLRRLVFSIVNDNIFRLYNEADPALGKILRNIKIALSNQTQFKLTKHFDEYYLELTTCDILSGCVTIRDEDLLHEIYQIIITENEIPGILSKLVKMLTYQEIYKQHVRMILVALAIKKGYEKLGAIDQKQIKISPSVNNIELGEPGILWGVNYGYQAFKLNLSNGSILDSVRFDIIPNLSFDEEGRSVAWDGNNLWYSEWGLDSIFQIDPANGNVLKKFKSPGYGPQALAFGGGFLWHTDEYSNQIYIGQLVKTLVDETQQAGNHSVIWNGRNEAGNTVSSGVYYYQITANGTSEAKKMIMLKKNVNFPKVTG